VNKNTVFILKRTRRFYTKLFKSFDPQCCLKLDFQGPAASSLIKEVLTGKKPCMVCRLGSNELKATLNHLDITNSIGLYTKSIEYIRGEIDPFWWDDDIKFLMLNFAGFFPANANGNSREFPDG